MMRKSLWKRLGASILMFSLVLSPMAALSVQAAEKPKAPEEIKEGGAEKAQIPKNEVSIPVWGFRGSLDGAKIYSVDVEWGAMTFQYAEDSASAKVWDPDTHSYKTGSSGGGGTSMYQWQVYDSELKSVADSDLTSINQISVINHSNAEVKAEFSFAGAGTPTPLRGKFTVGEGTDKDTSVTNPEKAGIKLATADNNKGEGEGVGKEVIGKVFFMPDGPYPMTGGGEMSETPSWRSLGDITVTIGADSEEETP